MKRSELFNKAKEFNDCEMLVFMLYAIRDKKKQLDAIMSVASDNEINGALALIGKEERLTGG
jgi:hypothetical protein